MSEAWDSAFSLCDQTAQLMRFPLEMEGELGTNSDGTEETEDASTDPMDHLECSQDYHAK